MRGILVKQRQDIGTSAPRRPASFPRTLHGLRATPGPGTCSFGHPACGRAMRLVASARCSRVGFSSKRRGGQERVRAEALILNAWEYYVHCRDHLSETAARSSSYASRSNKLTLARRRFLFVPTSDVKREPDRQTFKVDKVHPVHQIYYAGAAAAAASTPPPLEVGTD